MRVDRGDKAPKRKVKIPWDILDVYSEHLPDELDETDIKEELIMFEASKPRLKVRLSSLAIQSNYRDEETKLTVSSLDFG